MSKALEIAQYIYNQGYTDKIKLHKLLYISFGFYGAKYQKYLFEDVIEAWQFGPVIPAVYWAGKDGFFTTQQDVKLNMQEQLTIDEVLSFYGQKAPFLLVELTHKKNTPWSNAYIKGRKNIEIKKENIIRYYADFLNKTDQIVKHLATEDFKKVMENLAKT